MWSQYKKGLDRRDFTGHLFLERMARDINNINNHRGLNTSFLLHLEDQIDGEEREILSNYSLLAL